MRRCVKCGRVRPLSDYYRNGNVLRTECKDCFKEAKRQAYTSLTDEEKQNKVYRARVARHKRHRAGEMLSQAFVEIMDKAGFDYVTYDGKTTFIKDYKTCWIRDRELIEAVYVMDDIYVIKDFFLDWEGEAIWR